MHAQNELSAYFAEIDLRTDNALKGIREVRRSAKLRTLPGQPKIASISTGFLIAFSVFLTLFLD